MFPRNNHRIIFEYIKERTDSFALCAQNDRLFSRCERRKARGNPFFLFRGITDSFALRAQNDRLFSRCERRKARGNPFLFLGVLRILSRFALRMTGRLSLRAPKGTWQSVFPFQTVISRKKPPDRRFFYSLNSRRAGSFCQTKRAVNFLN